MKGIVIILVLFCYVYAADDFQIIHSNTSVLKDIAQNVLALPCNDITKIFLKYLTYQLHIPIFEETLDEVVAQMVAKQRYREACIVTFFAIYFDWQNVIRTIHNSRASVEITPEENERMHEYLENYAPRLYQILNKLASLSPDNMFILWWGLLLFEYEKQDQFGYDNNVLCDMPVAKLFQENFPKDRHGYCCQLATSFSFMHVLRALNSAQIDVLIAAVSDQEKQLSKEKYFAVWKSCKGNKDAISGLYLPLDTITCGDMILYSKKFFCLHFLIHCSNHEKEYAVNFSNQRLDSLQGVELIPAPSQCADFCADFNCIRTVPSFDRLSGLKKLSLAHNFLHSFPKILKTLPYLQQLILDNNNIHEFPNDVDGFDALQELSIAFNRITTFPARVNGFKNLKSLNMERNLIELAPLSVQGLSSLTKLYLSGNKITTCSFLIKGLEQLKVLHV